MEQQSKRGGKRPGAGRPIEGEPKKKATIYIECELIDQLTEALPRTRDKYINKVLKREAKKSGYFKEKQK